MNIELFWNNFPKNTKYQIVDDVSSPFYYFFTDLRMELLDGETNNDLLHALQALLMLLPQSNAFRILRDRLNCLQRVNPNFTRSVY